MAGLDDLWARFSLTEDEEGGADVPYQEEVVVHRLAGKFFTKRVLNVDAVARTFKPLWKLAGELKIRDSGDNVLVFEFDDIIDLERVLEYEPWSYDKSLIAFQRVTDVELLPQMIYNQVTFWVQLHNLPLKHLTYDTGEAIGNAIGRVVQVADPEDDGAGGEFLRVRVTMDISKPLPRCSKLRSDGKQIGMVALKYERLTNFCYWCGRANHGERDCEVWLRGRGKLRREEQQYGEWLRAEPIRQGRKSVVVISGRVRNQPPWWKKNQPACSKEKPAQDRGGDNDEAHSAMAAENYMDNCEVNKGGGSRVVCDQSEGQSSGFSGELGLNLSKAGHEDGLDEEAAGLSSQENCSPPCRRRSESPLHESLVPVSPSTSPHSNNQVSIRTWKRLARETGNPIPNYSPMIVDRRSSIETIDLREGKKMCLTDCGSLVKEHLKLVTGSQHHRTQ